MNYVDSQTVSYEVDLYNIRIIYVTSVKVATALTTLNRSMRKIRRRGREGNININVLLRRKYGKDE